MFLKRPPDPSIVELFPFCINSLGFGVTYAPVTGSSLVEAIACCLFGTKASGIILVIRSVHERWRYSATRRLSSTGRIPRMNLAALWPRSKLTFDIIPCHNWHHITLISYQFIKKSCCHIITDHMILIYQVIPYDTDIISHHTDIMQHDYIITIANHWYRGIVISCFTDLMQYDNNKKHRVRYSFQPEPPKKSLRQKPWVWRTNGFCLGDSSDEGFLPWRFLKGFWLNSGDLRRHRTHYDVIAMLYRVYLTNVSLYFHLCSPREESTGHWSARVLFRPVSDCIIR